MRQAGAKAAKTAQTRTGDTQPAILSIHTSELLPHKTYWFNSRSEENIVIFSVQRKTHMAEAVEINWGPGATLHTLDWRQKTGHVKHVN